MADGEEDFSKLPLVDRFNHKNWKARKGGYEAAAAEFEKTPDEADPAFRPFLQDPGLWKSAAGDSNVAAQQDGLAALCAFLKYGGVQAARTSRGHTLQPIYEKGLSSTRPQAKASALEAILLYVELDKSEPVIEELLPALSHKQPKIIAATLGAITAIFHNFGVKIVEPKSVLKALPKVFGHADKNVRAEAQNLTVELYRWLKDAMRVIFWSELKPVQQQDLEKLFEKVKEEPPPKQQRLTRSQQVALATAPPPTMGGHEDGEEVAEEAEEAEEVNPFDLAEPVDVYSKIPPDFHEMISSTKWKDRKDALDNLFNILNTPRIKEAPFDDLVRAFAKCMKDANVAVVTAAANCVEKLALGLRKSFARYRSTIMSPMMERFKEKKQSVADALGAGLDAVFASTSLTECLEETLGFLQNKNPNVKAESIKFLARCLRTTRDVPSKEEQKRLADAGTKLLTESTENLRSGGAEILGISMKIIGERAMNPYLDGLDEIRKAKIKEFFDTAQVKAKEKPKPAPAPAKGTSAVGKKVLGGSKKPAAAAATTRKPAPAAAPVEDAAPLQPKPTAKAAPKPTGLARPGLAQPANLKLGGLKKPVPGGLTSPRRVISPPASTDGDEEIAAPSPSKFGMGRGGLAGRPLARPVAAPLSPPTAAPVSSGLSTIERAELEELRGEKERLASLADNLRTSNAKLTAEISELQNQNAQLIEDHTRDVLQIKAKETQLVRARGECDVLKAEIESIRKESERYKREVSRLGRESIGREREDMMRGRGMDDPADPGAGGIYEDSAMNTNSRYPANGNIAPPPRPTSTALHRTGSSASTQSGRARPSNPSAKSRPQSGYASQGNRLDLSPSEEKENHGLGMDSLGVARRKISPPVMANGASGRSSPQRPAYTTMSRESSDAGAERPGVGSREPSSGARPEENWKRAAEVTSQLKARIEAMKKMFFASELT
ncbi:hypothetical protein A1O7_00273 [Cladophialophora yegresii CBS 114405]|uniref:TOG domain-containing protein n=1 Tax=Cladophialophora yegresii CBS 114405 TaxID=1182544 RepID=W9W7K7_9EURO|nr:uncharacterized protein A1O7_00273 [Cladophialophora yegresii CBS 114405]EXJ63938.1 hypothetical protein A1O7_00273 [Cladophialophora yegresii CBS 114405]